MFSKLEWLVICCAEDYDSTSEWKTAKSLSWMYTLPFSGFILLLFGGKKIPELMKGLGKGMKEFKDAKKDISKETEDKDEK